MAEHKEKKETWNPFYKIHHWDTASGKAEDNFRANNVPYYEDTTTIYYCGKNARNLIAYYEELVLYKSSTVTEFVEKASKKFKISTAYIQRVLYSKKLKKGLDGLRSFYRANRLTMLKEDANLNAHIEDLSSRVSAQWVLDEMRRLYDDTTETRLKNQILDNIAKVLARFQNSLNEEISDLEQLTIGELIVEVKKLILDITGSDIGAEFVERALLDKKEKAAEEIAKNNEIFVGEKN